MPDNKKKIGKPDRGRVSVSEPYEVRDLAQKSDLPIPLVKNVIRAEGPMRPVVEKYLKKMKSASGK